MVTLSGEIYAAWDLLWRQISGKVNFIITALRIFGAVLILAGVCSFLIGKALNKQDWLAKGKKWLVGAIIFGVFAVAPNEIIGTVCKQIDFLIEGARGIFDSVSGVN